jgi:glycosyltransferase involved in cell wall biosynthesis
MGVFNGAETIEASVSSLLNQTFADLEIVVVDDASTDGTKDYLESLSDARVRVLRNDTNLGLTKSLNIAADAATGQYIARQDADDVSLPERLEKQLAWMNQDSSLGVVGCGVEFLAADGAVVGEWTPPSDDATLRKQIHRSNIFAHGSVVMRADVFRRVGKYSPAFRYSQDHELWFRMMRESTLGSIPETLYRLHRLPSSISRSRSTEQILFSLLARAVYSCPNNVVELVEPVKPGRVLRAEYEQYYLEHKAEVSEALRIKCLEAVACLDFANATTIFVRFLLLRPALWQVRGLVREVVARLARVGGTGAK